MTQPTIASSYHPPLIHILQVQKERDDLYSRFTKVIHEVQQKSGFKNLLLEKKLTTLADTLVHVHVTMTILQCFLLHVFYIRLLIVWLVVVGGTTK